MQHKRFTLTLRSDSIPVTGETVTAFGTFVPSMQVPTCNRYRTDVTFRIPEGFIPLQYRDMTMLMTDCYQTVSIRGAHVANQDVSSSIGFTGSDASYSEYQVIEFRAQLDRCMFVQDTLHTSGEVSLGYITANLPTFDAGANSYSMGTVSTNMRGDFNQITVSNPSGRLLRIRLMTGDNSLAENCYDDNGGHNHIRFSWAVTLTFIVDEPQA